MEQVEELQGKKACAQCSKEKNLIEFYRTKNGADGRMKMCIQCFKENKEERQRREHEEWERRRREREAQLQEERERQERLEVYERERQAKRQAEMVNDLPCGSAHGMCNEMYV
ncbi:hypothetical protein KSB_88130 [Ktedonobacter robiniae]|uniref:Stc1 domain-containing protein n=2 Tax=Ktedonobacter robiniae TaxID=2778365 RepID=A0ABQ3V5P5_9CHLR|nr:hypothetical protein KSB_88130 [Ktedonobacter robiniae]